MDIKPTCRAGRSLRLALRQYAGRCGTCDKPRQLYISYAACHTRTLPIATVRSGQMVGCTSVTHNVDDAQLLATSLAFGDGSAGWSAQVHTGR